MVDRHRAFNPVLSQLPAVGDNSCVVHQDVELAKLSTEVFRQPPHVSLRRQICEEPMEIGVSRLVTDLGQGSVTTLTTAAMKNDGGAESRQRKRGLFSDTAGSSGDETHRAVHIHTSISAGHECLAWYTP